MSKNINESLYALGSQNNQTGQVPLHEIVARMQQERAEILSQLRECKQELRILQLEKENAELKQQLSKEKS